MTRWPRSAARALAAAAAVAAVAAFVVAAGCGDGSPGRLVVLLTIDTLRADRLGAWGFPDGTSPALDRLARGATQFPDARSVSSWTMPALGTLGTGVRPNEHGMQYWHMPLADGVPTLGDLLAEVGAEAAFFGNPIPRLRGLDHGFARWETFEGDDAAAVDAAIDWIGRPSGRDRLLWVHLLSPHAPYDPRPGTIRPPDPRGPAVDPRTPAYEAEIRTVDLEVARLLGALPPGTPVLFTADHGETLDERGDFAYDHGSYLWEELVRVPLAVRLPGAPGRIVRGPALLADVTATIAALFAATPPAPEYGASLLPAARGEGARPPLDATFAFVVEDEPPRRKESRWAVRTGDVKLVLEVDRDRTFLYDLQADPGERNDLAAGSPERVAAARRALDDWRARAPIPRIPFGKRFTTAEMERLKSLGYLGGSDR